MPFERYEILLPLNYNDGTPIEPENFQETRRELVEQFGALTMDAPTISGLWVSGGREYRDELLRFVIDTEATADTDAFFRDLKERLKEAIPSDRNLDYCLSHSPAVVAL